MSYTWHSGLVISVSQHSRSSSTSVSVRLQNGQKFRHFRLHRMHEMQTIVTDEFAMSVPSSVSLSVTRLNSAARAVCVPRIWRQPNTMEAVFLARKSSA